ncbi:putative restriction endonuclease [Escherichia coli]|uniref:restriction endonuclease n=2 Tax=Escherichia coli TaxID=562 RepID=UPI000DA45107|nr:putative restriction endonuclease [Escherichia coli]
MMSLWDALRMNMMISYQELVRTFPKTFYGCDEAMVVTNSYFTRSAKELAESALVRLIDRDELQKYLDDYNQKIIEDFQSN